MRLLAGVFVCVAALGANREVAITIDDLPRGGDGGSTAYEALRAMTTKLLEPFRKDKIPVTGFVNAGRGGLSDADLTKVLNQWLDAGADLGNHSYSHLNINDGISLADYTADITKGEPVLRSVLQARGKQLVYYRHPFLFTGPTVEIKREMQTFLDTHHYRVAPVTFDDSDYEYAKLYLMPEFRERVRIEYVPYMESVVQFFERRSVEVVGREFPQILLIHASQMNADLMPELLAMFRKRGYTFISLDHALADPAYQLPEEYVGRGGFSWIHRWSKTKGMPGKGEPDPPKWVEDASK